MLMVDQLVSFEQLKVLFERKTAASIINKLHKDGIPYLTTPSGNPYTTMAALNNSMGLGSGAESVASEDKPVLEVG